MGFTKVAASGITTDQTFIFTNINASGVITATSFSGDGSGLENVEVVGVNTSGTSTFSNINASGVITATSFSGDGSNLSNTGSTLSAASGSQRVVLTSQTSGTMTASSTDSDLAYNASTNTLSVVNFSASGNVSIAGTLTYEDVTNVDSIGLITARSGVKVQTGSATTALVVEGDTRVTGILTIGTSSITLDGTNDVAHVGAALTLGHTEGLQYHTQNLHAGGFEVNNINASGIITASSFYGDGSNLVGAGATLLGELDDVVVDNIGVGTDQTLIWNNSLGRWERGYPNALPIFGSATLTSSDSSDGRFSNEQFSLAINMNDEGYPVSTKKVKLSITDSTNIISRATSSDISSVNSTYSYSDLGSMNNNGPDTPTHQWKIIWSDLYDAFIMWKDSVYSGDYRIKISRDGETWTNINTATDTYINGSQSALPYIFGLAQHPNTGMFLMISGTNWNSSTSRTSLYSYDLINWYTFGSYTSYNTGASSTGLQWCQQSSSVTGYWYAIDVGTGNYGRVLRFTESGTSSTWATGNQTWTQLYYSKSQNTLIMLGQGNHGGNYHAKFTVNPDASSPTFYSGWYVSGGSNVVDMPYGVVYAEGSFNQWYWLGYDRQVRSGAPSNNFDSRSGLTLVKDLSLDTGADLMNGSTNGSIWYDSELDILLVSGQNTTDGNGIIRYCVGGDTSTWYTVRYPENHASSSDSYYLRGTTGDNGGGPYAYSPKLKKYLASTYTSNSSVNDRIWASNTLGITTTRTLLTFNDSVGLSTFTHAEAIVQSDGNATGYVEEVNTSNSTMVVKVDTGTFTSGVGKFVSGGERNTSLVYAAMSNTGVITSFVSTDPGFITLSGSSPYTITMPATDDARVDLDAKFGAGSQMSVSVEASNKLGSVSGSATLTPTSDRTAASFTWNADTDAYTNTTTAANRIIDAQARMRRCLVTDAGSVTYLDADDSTKLAGDWIRLCEHTELDTARTGTHGAETANTPLRSGLSTWTAGTYRRGQLVIHSSSVWECLAETTTASPAAGSSVATLDGTAGQVMVEIPLFSVKHTRTASGSYNEHGFYLIRGAKTDDGYAVHPAFVQQDSSYRPFIYVGAYLGSGNGGKNSVSGQTNAANYTRAYARDEARDHGDGWSIMSLYQYNAIQWLMITEYQNMDSQEVLGNGAVTGSDYDVTTGLSNTRGNRCGNVYNAGGSTSDYVSYRGIENVYGRAYQWVDGANVTSGTSLYVTSDRRYMLETTTQNMTSYATIGGSDGGHIRDLSAGVLFISSSTTSGSSTTYAADSLGLSSGDRNMRVGGIAADGSSAGVFRQNYSTNASTTTSSTSSRISFAEE